MFRLLACLTALAAFLAAPASAAETDADYLPGGPLAGLRLPLLQGDHNEPPGHPGSVPELAEKAGGGKFTPQGQGPQWELYPGSVELWRSYMHKYMPIRSFFDRQSQMKLWTAPDLPGAEGNRVESYAAPLYWVGRHAYGDSSTPTGLKWDPVEVVRTGVKAPLYTLDLGELPVGLYCVRIVGAVETEQLQPFRKAAIVALKVNDGADGETNTYRVRINYVDEFYSVVEIYFHAPVERAYAAELWLDEGSAVDLLVRNIVLDDVLAGCDRRAIKTRTVLNEPPQEPKPSTLTAEQRMERDAAIWRAFPPINAQGGGSRDRNAANPHIAFTSKEVQFGVDGMDEAAVAEKWGAWRRVTVRGRGGFADDAALGRVFMTNPDLNLEYTVDDLRAGRPLPDPYPYKDTGLGVITQLPETNGKQGQVLCPIPDAVDGTRLEFYRCASQGARQWVDRGNADAAHDAAVGLVRFAYQFPAIDTPNQLPAILSVPGLRGMDSRFRKRSTAAFWLPHYANYHDLPDIYDQLFSYIKDNEQLARSVGRFVPWVKTPEDVIELLDVYLLQTNAKRQMRYQYHTGPYGVLRCAAVLGEAEAARPLIDWTFASAWKYPLNPAGVQNVMITAHDRTGRSYVGSWYYATPAWQTAEELAPFKTMGLLPPEYDVSDNAMYPKPVASLYWALDSAIAGRDFPRIADVCGPDKRPWAHLLPKLQGAGAPGWRATGDPVFARTLVELNLRKGFTDAEWAEVEKAAATLDRAPWLDNRSRQVYNWCGVLETGLESDHFRNRRAAYLRVGAGYGHHHNDTLDLQFSAFGLPMTIDGGQRPAYSTPTDRANIVHNLVGVRGWPGRVNSWVRHIADAEGARYLSADAAPAGPVTRYRRGIALVDVPATPLPSAYIVDFFRVDGGDDHTYQFHGPLSDEVTAEMAFKPVDNAAPLAAFKASKESWLAGAAPEDVRVTWRYQHEVEGPAGGEKEMLGNAFDPAEPRKYTRLHLLGVKGAEAYRADAVCRRWKYRFNQLLVRRPGENQTSAFAAVIEPYAGEPFIETARRLPVDGDTARTDAAAVEVVLRDGRRDVTLYADDIAAEHTAGPLKATGEFAFLSTDDGVRQAVLARGTLLQAGDLTLRIAQPEFTARAVGMDYPERTLTLDRALPATAAGAVAEIVSGRRTTSATVKSVDGKAAVMKLGATYFRSVIQSVDADAGTVTCKLAPNLGGLPGVRHDFVASDDLRTTLWRADYIGNDTWKLTGNPVSLQAFGPSRALRIWEYGTGDTVRLAAWASVLRTEDGWQLSGNADCTVTLPGGAQHTVTADQLAEAGGVVVLK